MLKLKLQYFGHLMRGDDSLEKFWCWEELGAGGEGDDRGWDGWMASLTQWTWIWVNSGSWWWTGRPGVLRFMGSQRVRQDWATELNWRIASLFNFKNKALKQKMGNVKFAKLRLFLDVHVLYCFQYFAYCWRILVVLRIEIEIRGGWLAKVMSTGLLFVLTPWSLSGTWTQLYLSHYLPSHVLYRSE